MRKNRNSFFSEANMSYSGYNPNMNMNMMAANAPYQASSAYNSFYSGPNPNLNPNYNYMNNNTDLENRLAKIERQINRLEHRLSKLEANGTILTDDYDTNTTNMYML